MLIVAGFVLFFLWRYNQNPSAEEEMQQLAEEHLTLRQKYGLDLVLHDSLLTGAALAASLPADEVWKTMLKTNYEERFGIIRIEFDESLSALDGHQLHVQGYMIPFEQSASGHQHFILSYYPYANCYFCGQAGPESVIEVFARSPQPYRQTMVELKGILRLNADDPDRLFHILEDAELLP